MAGFIGTGKIKLALYSSGASFAARKFTDVGNASVFQYSFSEEKKELKDFQDPAGGTDSTVTRINTIDGQIDLRDFKASNLALALWGTTSTLNTTAITGEAHVINASAFIPTNRIINTTVAPVVKKGATVVSTNDYTVSAGGITIAATISTATVVDGDAITIDYTPKASVDIQALINSAPEVSIFFEGYNQVTGKASMRRIYKAKLGVAQNINEIGEDFGTLQVSLSIQKDTTVSGTGVSQFISGENES
jgi:hypothetical protein